MLNVCRIFHIPHDLIITKPDDKDWPSPKPQNEYVAQLVFLKLFTNSTKPCLGLCCITGYAKKKNIWRERGDRSGFRSRQVIQNHTKPRGRREKLTQARMCMYRSPGKIRPNGRAMLPQSFFPCFMCIVSTLRILKALWTAIQIKLNRSWPIYDWYALRIKAKWCLVELYTSDLDLSYLLNKKSDIF